MHKRSVAASADLEDGIRSAASTASEEKRGGGGAFRAGALRAAAWKLRGVVVLLAVQCLLLLSTWQLGLTGHTLRWQFAGLSATLAALFWSAKATGAITGPAAWLAAGAALACALFFLLLLPLWPVYLSFSYPSLGWRYDFQVLADGHRPDCDVDAMVQELLSSPCEYPAETPHWDPAVGRCDCGRPAQPGAEGGRCSAPGGVDEFPTFTAVAALVDLGRVSRSGCDYLKMFKTHLCRNTSLVVFCEAWVEPFVRGTRRGLGLEGKTHTIVLTQESPMAFYPDLPAMMENGRNDFLWHKLHAFSAGIPGRVVGQYGFIMHQKLDFMMQAVQNNWFGTSHFAWIDAGANHGALLVPQNFCACNIAVPGTATLFHRGDSNEQLIDDGLPCYGEPDFGARMSGKICEVPLKTLTWEDYKSTLWYRHDFTEIMGGFWGGDPVGLALLFRDYNETVHRLLEFGHDEVDQGVFSLIAAQHPPYLRLVPSEFYGVAHMC